MGQITPTSQGSPWTSSCSEEGPYTWSLVIADVGETKEAGLRPRSLQSCGQPCLGLLSARPSSESPLSHPGLNQWPSLFWGSWDSCDSQTDTSLWWVLAPRHHAWSVVPGDHGCLPVLMKVPMWILTYSEVLYFFLLILVAPGLKPRVLWDTCCASTWPLNHNSTTETSRWTFHSCFINGVLKFCLSCPFTVHARFTPVPNCFSDHCQF